MTTKRSYSWLVVVLTVGYLSGVVVRHFYGIAVTVTNQSGQTLRDVSVKVERRGGSITRPLFASGESWRVYVKAVGESSINLYFTDSGGAAHDATLAAYVENGYVGSASAIVMPGANIQLRDETFRIVYWKSWLEFF